MVATDKALLAQVKQAIHIAIEADPGHLTATTKLFADLGVDSVDLLDILYEIEKLTGQELVVTELLRLDEQGTLLPGQDLPVGKLAEMIEHKRKA